MVRDYLRMGIKPDVWKLEGLTKASEWKKLAKIVKAPMIVLGRGQSKAEVERWVVEAAKSGVVDGFAIGRTIFMGPLLDYTKKKCTRAQAVDRIAKNYLHFVNLWHKTAIK
ncbi:MAG: 5-dehydro-2-deoxygluconokinase [Candidatus Uhrbacteria bacterium GW2011_GWD2_52_7]|uniref:5-dehydro-2-deoxygluconokinase n=1 Tax=Candidatus Uhrbacteria bacterium GW2011_GWD2_52_7 TaxID=1618989 RepID=A0A0G2ACZ1_9BACT|nr:MAG: 5-dehydro-2-deoxygluconokinase [Candidatus Uhrbacteria bacterium GW2011_GWD2_52_7]